MTTQPQIRCTNGFSSITIALMDLTRFRVIDAALLIVSTSTLLLLFFLPIKDTDFGWHYRCGEDFLTQKKLCVTNEYSYLLPNYRWSNPNFIYDVSLALIYNHFGFLGVSIFGSIVFTLIFLTFFLILSGSKALRIFVISLSILLSSSIFSLGYRSQIFGLLFFVSELLILNNVDFTNWRKHLNWLLPLHLFLWANSHPSFFLGPLVLALYASEKIIRIFMDKNLNVKRAKKTANIFSIIFFALLSTFATLINPFGLRIYQEVINHFLSPLNQMIAEWVSPTWWLVLLILAITTFLIIHALEMGISLDYRFALLVIFAYFAILARRNLPLYFIVAFWLISEILSVLPLFERRGRLMTYLCLGFLGLLSFYTIFFTQQISRTIAFSTNDSIYCSQGLSEFPCEMAEKLSNKTGNLFNMYEQGGFLVWKLPQMKVFVDGRMPAWTDENGISPYMIYLEILQTQPGWNEKLKKYGTDYLLINNGTYLDLLLQEKDSTELGWRQEYRNERSTIYEKIKSKP